MMFEAIKNLFKKKDPVKAIDLTSIESKLSQLIKIMSPKPIPDNQLVEVTTTTQSGKWTINTLRGSQTELSQQLASKLGSRRLGTELFVVGSYWDGTQNEAVLVLIYTT